MRKVTFLSIGVCDVVADLCVEFVWGKRSGECFFDDKSLDDYSEHWSPPALQEEGNPKIAKDSSV